MILQCDCEYFIKSKMFVLGWYVEYPSFIILTHCHLSDDQVCGYPIKMFHGWWWPIKMGVHATQKYNWKLGTATQKYNWTLGTAYFQHFRGFWYIHYEWVINSLKTKGPVLKYFCFQDPPPPKKQNKNKTKKQQQSKSVSFISYSKLKFSMIKNFNMIKKIW